MIASQRNGRRALRHAFPRIVLVMLLLAGGCANQPRGVRASEGIANFAGWMLRSFAAHSQTSTASQTLGALGVATVINLRMTDDVVGRSSPAIQRQGMIYVNVPLPGLSAPTDAQVARLLALIESSPAPVFLRCEHGADRTGTIVACYRMRHDGWTAERLGGVRKLYSLSAWEVGMIRYVKIFSDKIT